MKKKKPALPKVRHTWKIKPETRVKPSGKIYHRSGEKKKLPTWVNDVDWYGDSEL
ncbi:MAG: hypothetical protein HY447_02030 [Candidatus Omnitrophica bacterium]|nr:hypothetical protein [Candidatus Omnitrophota bacterium]